MIIMFHFLVKDDVKKGEALKSTYYYLLYF